GVPTQSVQVNQPGRKCSGKTSPASTAEQNSQMVVTPRESSSQYELALTRKRQPKLTITAHSTEITNNGYVARLCGTYKGKKIAPIAIGTPNRSSAPIPARPRSIARYVATGWVGRSRSETTSPLRIRSDSSFQPHNITTPMRPCEAQQYSASWAGV